MRGDLLWQVVHAVMKGEARYNRLSANWRSWAPAKCKDFKIREANDVIFTLRLKT